MNDQATNVEHDELRSWAKGLYGLEAAVEVLIRAFGGRFARPGYDWIGRTSNGALWLDIEQLNEDTVGAMSGGERRLLLLTAALVEPRTIDLSDVASLDRGNVSLFLAAIAHAAGSHEHRRLGEPPLPSLYPWPDGDA